MFLPDGTSRLQTRRQLATVVAVAEHLDEQAGPAPHTRPLNHVADYAGEPLRVLVEGRAAQGDRKTIQAAAGEVLELCDSGRELVDLFAACLLLLLLPSL